MIDCVATVILATSGSLQNPAPISIDPTFNRQASRQSMRMEKRGPDASWIWAKHVSDNQRVRLTKMFAVKGAVKSAKLYLSVDNFYSVSLDGQLLGETKPPADDVDGWRNAKVIDVTRELSVGSHRLQVDARNAGGAAGMLLRLEINGKPAVFSDQSWKAEDLTAGGPAENVTVEAESSGGPWGGNVSGWPVPFEATPAYLSHLAIPPVRSCVDQNLGDPDRISWQTTSAHLDLHAPTPGKPWKVLLDFGKELSGRVSVKSSQGCTLEVGTGESTGEAIQHPYTNASLTLSPHGVESTRYSAFRYAMLSFPAAQGSASLEVNVDHLYYPVTYKGSFDCSDPLLTTLWYTGAYTAHLCMQQDIWDAPKRDRARWMGDLHVSGEVINNVFGDRFLMEQTMRRLRDDAQAGRPLDQLPQSHVNGIPGYSCAWLSGLADFYKHTGDLAYLKSEQPRIVSTMEFFRGEIGPQGTFANLRKEWPFVDWSPDFDKDTPQSEAATHLFLVKSLQDGAFLLQKCGDTANAAKYGDWANQLKSVARRDLVNDKGTYGDRRQENAMAVYSGVATERQREAIYQHVLNLNSPSWKQVATPYYNNYVIFAMSQLGHTQDALNFVRDYWGGMVKEGATTFWEAYDTSWDKSNSHIHLQADDGAGYFVSLCHGWSAGVTNWLTEEVVGIRSLDGGFSECEIKPDLGDLTFAKGSVPTPSGNLSLSIRKSGDKYLLDLQVPKGVKKAHIAMKALHIKVAEATGGGSSEMVVGPGRYHLLAQ